MQSPLASSTWAFTGIPGGASTQGQLFDESRVPPDGATEPPACEATGLTEYVVRPQRLASSRIWSATRFWRGTKLPGAPEAGCEAAKVF